MEGLEETVDGCEDVNGDENFQNHSVHCIAADVKGDFPINIQLLQIILVS